MSPILHFALQLGAIAARAGADCLAGRAAAGGAVGCAVRTAQVCQPARSPYRPGLQSLPARTVSQCAQRLLCCVRCVRQPGSPPEPCHPSACCTRQPPAGLRAAPSPSRLCSQGCLHRRVPPGALLPAQLPAPRRGRCARPDSPAAARGLGRDNGRLPRADGCEPLRRARLLPRPFCHPLPWLHAFSLSWTSVGVARRLLVAHAGHRCAGADDGCAHACYFHLNLHIPSTCGAAAAPHAPGAAVPAPLRPINRARPPRPSLCRHPPGHAGHAVLLPSVGPGAHAGHAGRAAVPGAQPAGVLLSAGAPYRRLDPPPPHARAPTHPPRTHAHARIMPHTDK